MAHPFQIGDRLWWQRETVGCGEPGDPLAMPLPLASLRAQAAVDLPDRRRELIVISRQQFLDPPMTRVALTTGS